MPLRRAASVRRARRLRLSHDQFAELFVELHELEDSGAAFIAGAVADVTAASVEHFDVFSPGVQDAPSGDSLQLAQMRRTRRWARIATTDDVIR